MTTTFTAPAVDTDPWWSRNGVASATGGVVTLINNTGFTTANLIEVDSTTFDLHTGISIAAEISPTGGADEEMIGIVATSSGYAGLLRSDSTFYGVSVDIYNGQIVTYAGGVGTVLRSGYAGNAANSSTFETWTVTILPISLTQMTIEVLRGATSLGTATVTRPAFGPSRVAIGARTGGAAGIFKVRGVVITDDYVAYTAPSGHDAVEYVTVNVGLQQGAPSADGVGYIDENVGFLRQVSSPDALEYIYENVLLSPPAILFLYHPYAHGTGRSVVIYGTELGSTQAALHSHVFIDPGPDHTTADIELTPASWTDLAASGGSTYDIGDSLRVPVISAAHQQILIDVPDGIVPAEEDGAQSDPIYLVHDLGTTNQAVLTVYPLIPVAPGAADGRASAGGRLRLTAAPLEGA